MVVIQEAASSVDVGLAKLPSVRGCIFAPEKPKFQPVVSKPRDGKRILGIPGAISSIRCLEKALPSLDSS
jgi:hypothetical protein